MVIQGSSPSIPIASEAALELAEESAPKAIALDDDDDSATTSAAAITILKAHMANTTKINIYFIKDSPPMAQ